MAAKGKTRSYYSTYNFAARVSLACKRQWTTAITAVGQNVCGAFVRLLQPTSKRAIEQWRPTARQKRLYLHHQGEFQHNYYAFI